MNGVAHLTHPTACWHDSAQISEGPTTNQRNWWCPACGAQRTTFPGDSAEAHFAARAARSQAPAVAPAIANSHYEVAKIGDALAPPSIDDVLTLADAHAEESHENGDRRFDRGGLYQFAKELLTKQKAIGVEVVGVVRPGGEDGAEVEWLLEGGLHAVAEGGETYLLVSHEPITNDDGYGEVYRASQPPVQGSEQ